MKEDAKVKIMEAMLRINDAMKAAVDSVNDDKPMDAIEALLLVSDGCERLAGAMVRIEAVDTGKRVEELCSCESCKLIQKEIKEKNERKATSPLN